MTAPCFLLGAISLTSRAIKMKNPKCMHLGKNGYKVYSLAMYKTPMEVLKVIYDFVIGMTSKKQHTAAIYQSKEQKLRKFVQY